MEIVLAVLLLLGGFTLGSITADKGGDASPSTRVVPHATGILDSHPITQGMRQNDHARCHSGRTVIYRDLTVSYHSKIDQQADQTDDCEGECPNE